MMTAQRPDIGPTQSDNQVGEFVERFQGFGADPTPETFDGLFHPAGTFWDAGMDSPLQKSQLYAAAERFVRAVSHVQIAVRRYFARNDCVYLLTDTIGVCHGTQVSFPAVYACRLCDGLIIDGRCFYDQARLLAPIIGSTLVLPVYFPTRDVTLVGAPAVSAGGPIDAASFVQAYDALWHADSSQVGQGLAGCYNSDGMILNPGMIRPITKPEIPGYYATLLAVQPDLNPELQGWAGDSNSLCVEWLYRAAGQEGSRGPLAVRVVDVFEFARGGIQFGHAYHDSLTILSASNSDLTSLVAQARADFFR